MLWAGSTKITGRKISEMLGQGWRDAVHPDDLKHLDKTRTEALRTGTPYEHEYRLRGADGTWHRIRGRAVPRRDENGKIIGWYGLVEDLDAPKPAKA